MDMIPFNFDIHSMKPIIQELMKAFESKHSVVFTFILHVCISL